MYDFACMTLSPRNAVLQRVAGVDPNGYARLQALMQPIQLTRESVLSSPRDTEASVYFVESGIVSVVMPTAHGQSVEVALIGREGIANLNGALGGEHSPFELVVQVSGDALRVPTSVIREHVLSCTALHEELMAVAQQMMHQLAQSAVCCRFHTSVERLARWLLLTADRAGTLRIELTHEFIAHMVGSPRSAVSEAAAELRARRLIESSRGYITICDAERLREAACECYDALR
jgi:CRP-like cAMP-binding protein